MAELVQSVQDMLKEETWTRATISNYTQNNLKEFANIVEKAQGTKIPQNKPTENNNIVKNDNPPIKTETEPTVQNNIPKKNDAAPKVKETKEDKTPPKKEPSFDDIDIEFDVSDKDLL